MHTSTILTTLALAATGVFAQSECTRTLSAVVEAQPIPTNTEVAEVIAEGYDLLALASIGAIITKTSPAKSDLDNLCTALYRPLQTLQVPASISADYASYMSEFSEYSKSWAPTIASVAPKCTDIDTKVAMEMAIVSDTNGCKNVVQRAINGAESKMPKMALLFGAVAGVIAVAAN
ncbi:hypothetical protein QBC44DRAFT_307352 [Cladorrhinum sp. PSN332]|nr:hypothetical protein QBC44DRAFT_307352 [Cladorrhinum sp. PSN332]